MIDESRDDPMTPKRIQSILNPQEPPLSPLRRATRAWPEWIVIIKPDTNMVMFENRLRGLGLSIPDTGLETQKFFELLMFVIEAPNDFPKRLEQGHFPEVMEVNLNNTVYAVQRREGE